jgi:hypothetical protein
MIVWHGFGLVVVIVPAALFGLAELFLRWLAPHGPQAELHNTASLLAFLGSALLWPVGRLLNSDGGQPPFDPTTGLENPPAGGHNFFWVPVEFWGVILPVLGFFTWLGR